MSQVIATPISHPKNDIHKFRDIHLKLSKTDWISWKQELLATTRDRGLYAIITSADTLPSISRLNTTIVEFIRPTCLTHLGDAWHDWNNTAYNQILLCITPELQTAIDETDRANESWMILTRKFKSQEPSKISIVCTLWIPKSELTPRSPSMPRS